MSSQQGHAREGRRAPRRAESSRTAREERSNYERHERKRLRSQSQICSIKAHTTTSSLTRTPQRPRVRCATLRCAALRADAVGACAAPVLLLSAEAAARVIEGVPSECSMRKRLAVKQMEREKKKLLSSSCGEEVVACPLLSYQLSDELSKL